MDSDHGRETVVLLGSLLLSVIVTVAVIYLAVQSTDAAERNLLIGGLIGAPAFGGGMLAGYGMGRARATTGPTTNVRTDTADVNVQGAGQP